MVRPSDTCREPDGDGAGITNGLLRLEDQLLEEPRAVLQRTAVFIRSLVRWQQELIDQIPVRRIHIEDVESRPLGAYRGLEMPLLDISDVPLVHSLRLHRIQLSCGEARGSEGCFPGVEVRA